MSYTNDTVEAALLENADYEEQGSIAKAKAFVTAATRWQILQPQSASNQSSSLSLDKAWVEAEKARARRYISVSESASGDNPSVRFLSPNNNFRR